MFLDNAYIGLHLEPESEKIIKSSFVELQWKWNLLTKIKLPHLTLDYLRSIHIELLESLTFWTRVTLLLINKPKDASLITLWTPSHLISNITKENIFFLPAEINNWLFWHLQHQWYSIWIPHVTIFKWKNLTEGQINKTLESINNIIPSNWLVMNTKEVFFHGKTEDWEEIIKWFPCA